MSKKILGSDIEPKCEYCLNGTPAADGKHVLCKKTGIMDIAYSCKKFIYDPLKRTPRRWQDTQEYTAEDFSL